MCPTNQAERVNNRSAPLVPEKILYAYSAFYVQRTRVYVGAYTNARFAAAFHARSNRSDTRFHRLRKSKEERRRERKKKRKEKKRIRGRFDKAATRLQQESSPRSGDGGSGNLAKKFKGDRNANEKGLIPPPMATR